MPAAVTSLTPKHTLDLHVVPTSSARIADIARQIAESKGINWSRLAAEKRTEAFYCGWWGSRDFAAADALKAEVLRLCIPVEEQPCTLEHGHSPNCPDLSKRALNVIEGARMAKLVAEEFAYCPDAIRAHGMSILNLESLTASDADDVIETAATLKKPGMFFGGLPRMDADSSQKERDGQVEGFLAQWKYAGVCAAALLALVLYAIWP